MPTKAELDSYECRHGLGYSVFTGVKNELKAEMTAFVPIGSSCEVNKVTLTNESNTEKSFSLFSYVEFCLWNAISRGTLTPVRWKSMAPKSTTRQSTGSGETTMPYTP